MTVLSINNNIEEFYKDKDIFDDINEKLKNLGFKLILIKTDISIKYEGMYYYCRIERICDNKIYEDNLFIDTVAFINMGCKISPYNMINKFLNDISKEGK